MMARTKWIFGGQPSSQPAQDTKPAPEPVVSSADAKKFGFENFGNTCYANSVLQALYFCAPFRDLVIQTTDLSVSRDPPSPSPDAPPNSPSPQQPLVPVRRKPERKPSTSGNPPDALSATVTPPHPIPASPPTLFSALRSLFLFISTHPGDKGTVAPRAFIDKLKESKEDFRGTMHQDAHEFLNHLLNMIVEEIEEEKKSAQNNVQGEDLSGSLATLASKMPPTIVTATTTSNSGTSPQDATLVHKLFEGVLTSETRCLTCETVSSRDESFLDLSIDIEQNSSVTACLRSFSASEMLCQRNKFFCDSCCDLQEAEKRMKIKKLPNVLALHLKRFKFQEDVQKYIKLTYRVAFPHELRLFNTVDDLENADRLYDLFAIVVHIGSGPHHGHYISIVKSAGTWLVFDDDNVYPIPEGDIPKYYGDSNSGSAYVLYYQAADMDLVSLGLKSPDPLLLPDPQAESVGTQPRTPSRQSHQLVPSLPPGLSKVEDQDAESMVAIIPPPSHPPVSSTPIHDQSLSSVLANTSPPSSRISSSPPTASPASPTSRVLSPVRRAVSSHGRPSTATPSVGERLDRSMHSDSVPRSPRHSVSSPTLAVPDESSFIPPVPPLPDLTPAVIATPESKASSWFKRRSFRLGDKSKVDKNEKPQDDIPPSPFTKDGRPISAGWFKTSSQIKRRPSQIAVIDPLQKVENLMSHKLEPSQAITAASSNTSSNVTQQDGFSSSGPSIVLSSPPTTISPSPPPVPPKPSASPSKSSQSTEQVEFPPSRKSSLTPSPRTRASMDHRRDGLGTIHSFATQRPVTVAGSVPIPNGVRQLPSIPTSPQVSSSPSPRRRRNDSIPVPSPTINGTGAFVSERENIYPPGVNGRGPGHDTQLHPRPRPVPPTAASAIA
ncbi:putative ubiquitin carboxyl-terminal hydrolase creB [Leucoagaricus sp. SymC.cos]|nr:putative ubiquitin carboxyl-terminal hydrolase creB [Leucoagaricus sp. SymC.cos]